MNVLSVLSGSSRMKGGSMTEILLDTIFIAALSQAFGIPISQAVVATNPVYSTRLQGCGSVSREQSNFTAGENISLDVKDVTDVACMDGAAASTEAMKVQRQDIQHLLGAGHITAAIIVDVFAAVYQAAYRWGDMLYQNRVCMQFVHSVHAVLPRPTEGVASLMSLAADCLRHPDGHLYYIGAHTFGILGSVRLLLHPRILYHLLISSQADRQFRDG